MKCPFCKEEIADKYILSAGASLMAAKRHKKMSAAEKTAFGKKMVLAREAKKKLNG